jgi:hypothetical protein
MWGAMCLYAAVYVGTQRLGVHIGAVPAILVAMTGYYGSKGLFATVNRALPSQTWRQPVKVMLTIAYFPAAIILAMMIAEQSLIRLE